MTRKTFSALMAATLFLLVGTAGDAGATVTISLSWGQCGGGTDGCSATGTASGSTLVDTLTVNPGGGQTLRLDIFLSHDEPVGLVGHGFSINFDTDLQNELNLNPAMIHSEWGGTDTDPSPGISSYSPLDGTPAAIESTAVAAGRINTFESGSVGMQLPPTGSVYSVGTYSATAPAFYRVGQIFFTVNATVSTDGADVFSGLFNVPFDAILDSNGLQIPGSRLSFGTATLNVIPEPGTVSLLGLGLVGLVLAGRRNRRS